MEKIITYKEYGELVNDLAESILKVCDSKHFSGVYGFPKGGLPIAVHLANIFRIPLILYPFSTLSTILVVDDISHTGKTFLDYKNRYGDNFVSATLFSRKGTKYFPDFTIYETDVWIKFPWERLDEEPNR